MSTATKPSHIGYKIGRIRELRGLKQEFVAHELKVSQQTVSKIEQSETVDEELLEQISKILGVSTEGIKTLMKKPYLTILIVLTTTVLVHLTTIVPLTPWTSSSNYSKKIRSFTSVYFKASVKSLSC